jgi:hypothetical protein
MKLKNTKFFFIKSEKVIGNEVKWGLQFQNMRVYK